MILIYFITAIIAIYNVIIYYRTRKFRELMEVSRHNIGSVPVLGIAHHLIGSNLRLTDRDITMVIKKEKAIKRDKRKRHRLSVAALCANFFLGLIWFSLLLCTLVVDPIHLALKQYTRVTNGSFVHEFMKREMEGLHLRAYLFNVSNAQEFAAGRTRRLVVSEVGPFTYREMRSNVEVEIDEQRARLRYTPRVRLEFLPELSVASAHDVNVTVPNIPMLGTASRLASSAYITRLGFNLLTSQLASRPLVTLSAHDYMWGYSEPLVSLSHHLMPGSVQFDKMGILDRIYDSQRKMRLEVSIADEDKYSVKALNGHRKLSMSEDVDPEMCSLCDTFDHAYEGVGYPLGIPPGFPIKLYRVGLCRMFDMEYHGTKHMDWGADALVYHFNDNFYTLDPNTTSNGVLELPDCFMGVPLAFSKAHFEDVDPSVYERIDGLDPNPERFKSWITIDPKLGLQLETKITLQLNLVTGDISFNSQAQNFANMVLPISYIQIEQAPLPEVSKMFLNGVYHTGPLLLLGAQLCFLVLLLISWGYFTRAMYQYFTLKDETVMSFSLGADNKEINGNNIQAPLMNGTQTF